MPFGSDTHTQTNPVFNLWLNQWRLSILDSESATPVLAFVIDSMLAQSGQQQFWQHLEQFLSIEAKGSLVHSAAVDSSIATMDALEGVKDPDSRRQLAKRAGQLPPQEAKYLLEYLSRSHSLQSGNATFWRIVEQAILPGERQKVTPHIRLM
jgi:hypothetical protein